MSSKKEGKMAVSRCIECDKVLEGDNKVLIEIHNGDEHWCELFCSDSCSDKGIKRNKVLGYKLSNFKTGIRE